MSHLTVISHELTVGYFLLAVMRDQGYLADTAGSTFWGKWLEVYFAVTLAAEFFVGVVFWGASCLDPALMFDPEKIVPGEDPKSVKVRCALFQCVFKPIGVEHHKDLKTLTMFMQYLHTFVPMLPVVEALLVAHPPGEMGLELGCMFAYFLAYLCWNMFCWWLLKVAPYPLQKKLWQFGTPVAVGTYLSKALAAVFFGYVGRSLRFLGQGDSASAPSLILPAAVLWFTSGCFPFKAALQRYQGAWVDDRKEQ